MGPSHQSARGSIMAITPWLHYADHPLAPTCRSPSGSNMPVGDTSTLLFVVRTVAYLWRQENQARNVMEIARRGAALYDKLCGFVDDLQDVGKRIQQTVKAYDGALRKLAIGDGNVIRQAEMLRDLGVKPSKQLPTALVDKALSMAQESLLAETDGVTNAATGFTTESGSGDASADSGSVA
jgi:DNA recombination protein RmuC